jgi:SAM-dependent methyltransferase
VLKDLTIFQLDSTIDTTAMEQWYGNIESELAAGFLTEREADHFKDYYVEAGLLRNWRKPFFMHHYANTFTFAVQFLLPKSDKQRVILDLGCGSGTQSLIFAMLGAHVVGIDMDETALVILKKRQTIYEGILGRKLKIEIHCGNIFDIDLAALGPFDGVYSMFAFNMMQPTLPLLDRLLPSLAPHGSFVVLDGNNQSWLAKIPGRRRNVLSPKALEVAFKQRDFKTARICGAVSIPPLFWAVLPKRLARGLDRLLNRSWFWPISYQAMFCKAD